MDKVEVAEIKELRVDIAGVINITKTFKDILGRNPGGREIALVLTKLEEAKMWAGKILGELGSKLPEKYRDEAK